MCDNTHDLFVGKILACECGNSGNFETVVCVFKFFQTTDFWLFYQHPESIAESVHIQKNVYILGFTANSYCLSSMNTGS